MRWKQGPERLKRALVRKVAHSHMPAAHGWLHRRIGQMRECAHGLSRGASSSVSGNGADGICPLTPGLVQGGGLEVLRKLRLHYLPCIGAAGRHRREA